MTKSFKWTASISIEVAESLVAGGFELTDARLREILMSALMEHELRNANVGEFKVGGHITSAPPRDEIRAVQGYAPSRPVSATLPSPPPPPIHAAFREPERQTRCPICGERSHSHDCR